MREDTFFVGAYPDNALARDIFQVNLQAAALRSCKNPHTGGSNSVGSNYTVASATLVYGNPEGGKAQEHSVPRIPQKRLEELVGDAFAYITAVREKLADPLTPRALINVAWSFHGQRERYTLPVSVNISLHYTCLVYTHTQIIYTF